MSFLTENILTFLFYAAVFILVFLFRKRLESQGPLMYLLKTTLGLDLMDKISGKHRNLVKALGYISVAIGYLGFLAVMYILPLTAYQIIIGTPGVQGGGPALPGFEIQGTGIKIPLITGWISLLLIMVVHEFAHGVVARAHKVDVQSSGVGIIGIFPIAFVEIDEKKMAKKKHRVQNSVAAAGPFANIVLAAIGIGLMVAAAWAYTGVADYRGLSVTPMENQSLPAYSAGLRDAELLLSINGHTINNITSLEQSLVNITPNQTVLVSTDKGNYTVKTISNPTNSSVPYLGVNLAQDWKPRFPGFIGTILMGVVGWLQELFWWVWFLSLNVGLINLFPIFITDGARMLKLHVQAVFGETKLSDRIWTYANLAGLFLLLILLSSFFKEVISALLGIFGISI